MQKAFLSIIIILIMSFLPKKAETFKPVVVLELFTSQGCSSCPPADALLSQVKEQYSTDQIIALSYHVDYWNYLGWKDPFSKKAFSDKQRIYSSKFYSSTIYTPQVVINGKEHFVGSKKDIMKTKLNAYLAKYSENKVVISNLKQTDKCISFNYNVLGVKQGKNVRALLTINEKETFVKRGENKNRKLKNSNIVVAEHILNINANKSTLLIPDLVSKDDKLTLILLIENKDLDISGGSQLAFH